MSPFLRNGVIVAVLLACAAGTPVAAQSAGEDGLTGPKVTESRGNRRDRNNRNAQRATMSPEEALSQAQATATAAGIGCEVTEAKLLGQDAERQSLFEAACASGPGYILLASTPPITQNCLELVAADAATRRANPEAPPAQLCTLPVNLDTVRAITPYAQAAGVACAIDAARAVGRSADGVIYEVGCDGADGYQLVKSATGWTGTDCLRLPQGTTCEFTSAAEQARGFAPKLADSAAAGCDVQQVRFMGQNDNGQFYEAKCATDGEGYIARITADGVTAQIYPCATAQQIGGGCTLTPAPAVEAAPAPAE